MSEIALYCPKCREKLAQFSGEPKMDQLVTCAACGRINHCRELLTVDGETLVEYAKALAVKVFSGIEGFKPPR